MRRRRILFTSKARAQAEAEANAIARARVKAEEEEDAAAVKARKQSRRDWHRRVRKRAWNAYQIVDPGAIHRYNDFEEWREHDLLLANVWYSAMIEIVEQEDHEASVAHELWRKRQLQMKQEIYYVWKALTKYQKKGWVSKTWFEIEEQYRAFRFETIDKKPEPWRIRVCAVVDRIHPAIAV